MIKLFKKPKCQLSLIVLLFFNFSGFSQEEGGEELKNQIGLMMGHTNMKNGEVDASSNRFSVPSWTLFYNYHFNEQWSLGLHTDFVFEDTLIKTSGEETIERKKPIAPALMLGYKPGKHFTFLIGGGVDVDTEESLGLMRGDIEYGLEIRDGWEFGTSFGYDYRFDSYDSFQLSVGISKSF